MESMPSKSQRDFAQVSPRRRKSSGRREKTRRPKRSRGWGRRLFKWGIAAGLLGMILAMLGYWGLVFYFEHRLPEIFEPDDYIARTSQVTRVMSADGDVLSEIGHERRTVVASKDIPKLVKLAVLAAEDADFYDHDGLDYFGMARAMYKNVRDQKISQGASTITQQVAKTFFLSAERTVSRKLKEVVLARRLEHELAKDDILYLYLNQIYWGHGRYGVGEAARFYFGKKLSSLTLSDAALLAGMIAAPERFSPFRDERRATERRAFVLDQMARHDFIDRKRADHAKRQPIRLNFRGDPRLGLGGYAMDMVQAWLRDEFGAARVERGGLRVYTTLDARMQSEGEDAMQRGLRAVDRKYDLARPIEHLSKRRIPAYVAKLQSGISDSGVRSGGVVLGVVTGVNRKDKSYSVDLGLGDCRLPFRVVDRYRGHLEPWELFIVGDVLRVSPRLTLTVERMAMGARPTLNLDQGPQGALVAVDPHSRHIKALVGGFDHKTHPFNRAKSARRQAGSTFKPIAMAAALESGIYEPLSLLRNVPESYKMGGGRYWKPRNFSNTYDGRRYTARMALAKSINVIAVKIMEKTGVQRVIDFARRVGVTSPIEKNLSIALGSTALAPLELANAYSTFASGGYVQKPVLITRVEDFDGTLLYEAETRRKRGTTAKTAYRITEMMQAVVEHGTGKHVRHIGRKAAGKTGTTDNGIDTWFAGYTPGLVTTVWVGFDDRRPIHKATGGKLAAPIWARFMTAAHEGLEVADFRPPSGLEPLPPVRSPVAARRRARPAADEEGAGESDADGDHVVQQMELLYE